MDAPPRFVEFNGRKYRLQGRYYRAENWGKGTSNLHRAVWEHHHGPIPKGTHIHHRSGDTLDNTLDNLECVPRGQHLSDHARSGAWCGSEANRAQLAACRDKAAAWHRSAEGRAWHREHARAVVDNLRPVDRVCEHCGRSYRVLPMGMSKFCSNNCKTRARFKSGVDNETRACDVCGASFVANRYVKKRTCSKRCADTACSRTKGGVRSDRGCRSLLLRQRSAGQQQ